MFQFHVLYFASFGIILIGVIVYSVSQPATNATESCSTTLLKLFSCQSIVSPVDLITMQIDAVFLQFNDYEASVPLTSHSNKCDDHISHSKQCDNNPASVPLTSHSNKCDDRNHMSKSHSNEEINTRTLSTQTHL